MVLGCLFCGISLGVRYNIEHAVQAMSFIVAVTSGITLVNTLPRPFGSPLTNSMLGLQATSKAAWQETTPYGMLAAAPPEPVAPAAPPLAPPAPTLLIPAL